MAKKRVGGRRYQEIKTMDPRKMLDIASRIGRSKDDDRHFALGAVAIRGDGKMVSSYNGKVPYPDRRSHCEARLCRKLDYGSIVFLTRTIATGEWANSKPCPSCEKALKTAKVKKVYYTIGPDQWAILEF